MWTTLMRCCLLVPWLGWAAVIGTAQAQTGPVAIGSVESSASPAVRLEVTELKRIEGGFLSLKFRIENGSNSRCCNFAFGEHYYLVDNVNRKKYLVVRDT